MNRFPIRRFPGTALICSVLACSALAQTGLAAEVDRIVAIVNTEAVTSSQLNDRVTQVRGNLQKQGVQLPPVNVFERQVLDQLILERAQLQMARNASIHVDEAMVERAIGMIASNNHHTVDQLRATLARDGIPWNKFREDVRTEITLNRLRETEVDHKVTISDAEITSFLKNHPEALSGTEYNVAHILLRLPENPDESKMAALRERVEKVLSRLRAGEDFSKVAASSSDAPDKLQGGELGWREHERLPPFYAEALKNFGVGEVSPPMRSDVGVHIIKLLNKREKDKLAAQVVEQTHARHILLKTSEVLSDTDAQARIAALRERIINGADFAELAKANSVDPSAGRGGDLGWLYPGDTVPEFEKVMNALAPREVSAPVRSPLGWPCLCPLPRAKKGVRRKEERRRRKKGREKKGKKKGKERGYIYLRLWFCSL
ncbi:MAG: peptidylprolyl isomerase [Azoarcus sp.]|jgi:peptidyl-prolyl cis-trans isomerase SurA|nr:peptidylprolyl isomerase [Azoarcus sp.]